MGLWPTERKSLNLSVQGMKSHNVYKNYKNSVYVVCVSVKDTSSMAIIILQVSKLKAAKTMEYKTDHFACHFE